MINLKTPEQIEIMREGGAILGEVLRKLAGHVKAGIPTSELEKLAQELILSAGAKPSFLGYNGFPAATCISINDEIVHGLPSAKRFLMEGDLIKLDLGVFYKGFHTDSAITTIVPGEGKTKEHFQKLKLIATTAMALKVGIEHAVVGGYIGDIGNSVQEISEENGFGVVRDLVGHGIGTKVHEEPQVPNYGKRGEGEELVAGMVIAIEPMLVTGGLKIAEGKDGFVFKTKDGGLAAHFEHTVAITEKGPIILTE